MLVMVALPLGMATFTFNFFQNEKIGTTNNGELISPVMDITEFAMLDSDDRMVFESFETLVAGIDADDYVPRPWTLIFLGTNSCDDACGDRLFYLRQLHRLLGADEARIARYYLNAGAEREFDERTRIMFDEAFTGMTVVYSRRAELLNNLATILPAGVDPTTEHYIFLADPLGNVMLYFTPENTPEEILEDIEKLLARSSLG
tara:strand:- start:4876 stop:5484 length:609 start_codon:yes stop_codon:yes gene_type:complete